MCFSQWKQHSMALAEEVSRKLKALSRILVHWRHIQTSFLPLPPTRSLSPFSQPNSMTHSYNHCLTCIILPLSPSITLISKHLYPEVNPNLPYIFHSHGWHRTGGKNTSMHTHTHTQTLTFYIGCSYFDFLTTDLKEAVGASDRCCFSLINPVSQHPSLLFLALSFLFKFPSIFPLFKFQFKYLSLIFLRK